MDWELRKAANAKAKQMFAESMAVAFPNEKERAKVIETYRMIDKLLTNCHLEATELVRKGEW